MEWSADCLVVVFLLVGRRMTHKPRSWCSGRPCFQNVSSLSIKILFGKNTWRIDLLLKKYFVFYWFFSCSSLFEFFLWCCWNRIALLLNFEVLFFYMTHHYFGLFVYLPKKRAKKKVLSLRLFCNSGIFWIDLLFLLRVNNNNLEYFLNLVFKPNSQIKFSFLLHSTSKKEPKKSTSFWVLWTFGMSCIFLYLLLNSNFFTI